MSATTCTLQIFLENAWRDAAALDLTGNQVQGVAAPTYLIYLPDYAIQHWGRKDAAALSVNIPVELLDYKNQHWPPFLVDLLPQGYGRAELLRQLERADNAGPAADWVLLCAGAGNPIGNVRVKEAHEWVTVRTGNTTRGFSMDEVASRAEDFNEYLAQHGLFLAGSSGIQGEWPKILLTRAADGLFYLDHALPDEQAERHFIVKFGRGNDASLANILRLEAPYMRLAQGLGLRVHADLVLRDRALFIPRFDREVVDNQVLRHGQESIASLCGMSGFDKVPTHNDVCRKLGEVATYPAREIAEYIKRDIANIALGNKDNHGRNTAIQRKADGTVSLTPLFDFAPMWLHPDGIARRIRWEADDGGLPNWESVIAQACEAADLDEALLKTEIKAMSGPMAAVLADARALGIDEEFLVPLKKPIEDVRSQLEAM